MRVRSRAGLPVGPWYGRAMLVYRRTVWFGNDAVPMVGLLSSGMSAIGGMELETAIPTVRPGVRLESDGRSWFLEGVGELSGALCVLDTTMVLGARPTLPSAGWKENWAQWFAQVLPQTDEGRWLASLLDGPGEPWDALIGRGSGSTPLGDDYLAGWLSARWRLGLLTESDRGLLLRSLAGTTRLSRHYLWHLAEGRVDPSLGGFLAAQPLPEPRSPEAAVLAAHGDLSGRATLVGLVAGLTSGE